MLLPCDSYTDCYHIILILYRNNATQAMNPNSQKLVALAMKQLGFSGTSDTSSSSANSNRVKMSVENNNHSDTGKLLWMVLMLVCSVICMVLYDLCNHFRCRRTE